VQLRIRRGSPIFSDTALRRPSCRKPAGPRRPRTVRRARRPSATASSSPSMSWARRKPGCGLQGAPAHRRRRRPTDRLLRPPTSFWEPVYARRGPGDPSGLVLGPQRFLHPRLALKRLSCRPTTPPRCCPTTRSSASSRGALPAGFFDPGFGRRPKRRQRQPRRRSKCARTKCRSSLEHGQTMGRLVYEPLIARPDQLYGMGIGSSLPEPGAGAVEALQESAAQVGRMSEA